MEREVRAAVEAVFGAQIAQKLFYGAKPLLYVVDLALTENALVRVSLICLPITS